MAYEGANVAGAGREAFDGVVVGVGDVEDVVVEREGQRVLEAGVAGVAVAVAELEGVAANDGVGAASGVEIDGADGVGLGVGEEESAGIGGDAGGLGEIGGLERAVGGPFVAGAGEGPDFFGVEVEDPDLVESGHGDVEEVADEGEVGG